MADEHGVDNHEGGGRFMMGLLTGAVVGAGLGLLFAPKAGLATRRRISKRAGALATLAQEGYRKATSKADRLAAQAREAVSHGADEAQKYVRDVAHAVAGDGDRSPRS